MSKNLRKAYSTINEDSFPEEMTITFGSGDSRQTMMYQKVTWNIDNEEKGLRYGENPGQQACQYKLVNGNLQLGEVSTIEPGRYLTAGMELLQSGKHPGKINITDADSALNILKFFDDKPSAVVMKHNNPSGVSRAETISTAFYNAYMADRVAAFGGAAAINRPMDMDTARIIKESYFEVIIAPEFEEGTIDVLKSRKNLRIMKINNIERLNTFITTPFVDFKSLMDGSITVQTSYITNILGTDDFKPAVTQYKGTEYEIERAPTPKELEDMLFGWHVEAGVTSNSVIYVKDQTTVGIGTGEQDRVGVAEIARDKAYKRTADRLCFEKYNTPWNLMKDQSRRREINELVKIMHGGLSGSVMVSDAFFPFRDGVDTGIREGVTGIVQPGGSLRDFESIEACNEQGVTMVFTAQRSFKH